MLLSAFWRQSAEVAFILHEIAAACNYLLSLLSASITQTSSKNSPRIAQSGA